MPSIAFSFAFRACSAGVFPCLSSQAKARGTRTDKRRPSGNVNSTVPVRSSNGLPHWRERVQREEDGLERRLRRNLSREDMPSPVGVCLAGLARHGERRY